MKAAIVTSGLAICATVLVACDVDDLEDVSSVDQGIIGGSLSSCYPQVVRVDSSSIGCTGTLIGPSTVLTAAHCVVMGGQVRPPTSASGAGGMGNVTSIYVHPQYNKCQPAGTTFANAAGRDLAVVKLDRSILPAGMSAATLSNATPPAGTALTAVGFGLPYGDRRLGSFRSRSSSGPGELNISGVNAGMCGGDSGAGYFSSGGCSGSPAPVIVAVESSQALGESQSSCYVGSKEATADVANSSNQSFITSALAGNATPFDPNAALDCCTPGAVRACSGGTQTCGSDGRWGGCQSSGGYCGDYSCSGSETCSTCPYDCGQCAAICGDFVCGSGESCYSCPFDCGSCCNASQCSSACASQSYCGSCSFYGDYGRTSFSGTCYGNTCYCQEIYGSCTAC